MENTVAECVLKPRRVVKLGKAWADNGVNGMVYRADGITSNGSVQVGAYFDSSGAVRIFSIARVSGELVVSAPIVVGSPSDAHFAVSVAQDREGYIHVIGGAHVTRPFYCRGSLSNCGGISVELIQNEEFTEEHLTYPTFVRRGDGSLFLLYRLGRPGHSFWRASTWDGSRGQWMGDSWALFSGGGAGVWPVGAYFNRPVVKEDGRVGFFLVWRSEVMGRSRNTVMNSGIDYVEVDFSRRLAYSAGNLATPLPITPSISERVLALPWLAAVSNQSGAGQATCQSPFGAAIWREGNGPRQIWVFWRDNQQKWCVHAITAFRHLGEMRGTGTLYLPYSRPACVAFRDGTIGIIYRVSGEVDKLVMHRMRIIGSGVEEEEEVVLFIGRLGGYEPVVDCDLASSSSVLSIYIQYCGSRADGVSAEAPETSDACVVDWDIT